MAKDHKINKQQILEGKDHTTNKQPILEGTTTKGKEPIEVAIS